MLTRLEYWKYYGLGCIFLSFTYMPTADEEGEEDEDGGDSAPQYNKQIMPHVVISLDASDEFLKERVMNLPQSEVEGTHNTEEGDEVTFM